MNAISLKELNKRVSDVITSAFNESYWITAELSDVHTAAGGHCYLEFIEKELRTGAVIARARGVIWSNRWCLLKDLFEQETGQRFTTGIKIMACVQVQMHEVYGYSLSVIDINPTYTLGDMARNRAEIIKQLTADGILEMNKEIPLPSLPQRVAVISAQNAAGYGDFIDQLQHNEYGFAFYPHLFPAVMQGSQTESSIIAALDSIYSHLALFDVVVIIRGGGATVDLNSFDTYPLAANVAQFPLPVIVGIGHDRDNTILDIVAHTRVKTPTAAAAFLIDKMADQASLISNCQQVLSNMSLIIGQHLNKLSLLGERITMNAQQRISTEKQRLLYAERSIQMAQPENILKRGFSLTRINGHAVKSVKNLKPGDKVSTQVADGYFEAEIL